jgi:hypothetical protein
LSEVDTPFQDFGMFAGMSRTALAVNLSAEDCGQLARWEAARGTPQQVALRCRLAMAASQGHEDQEIAFEEAVNRHTVCLWRNRVRTEGIGAVWEIRAREKLEALKPGCTQPRRRKTGQKANV